MNATTCGWTELTVSRDGAVLLIEINRPAHRNAMTRNTAHELELAFRLAADDLTVNAVVLGGVGEHFSAGGDLNSMASAITGSEQQTTELIRVFHRLGVEIWESRLPVIAAVSGVAYGAGLSLALLCDLTVVSADARLCLMFLEHGIAPDLGVAWTLPRAVGMQRAKELMLLTPVLDAQQAVSMGMANAIAPDAAATGARALAMAQAISTRSPYAVGLTKKLVNHAADDDLRGTLEHEAVTQTALLRAWSPRRGRS
jgi:2-(1,2-epoxy-1,2-dihydrophenyl)acetyl-CoA isomerase